MKAKDLAVGDRVWCVLPYDGGKGWGTITGFVHMGATVEFDKDAHNVFVKRRDVALRSIVRKEET
jgi:hypothetical protein